ncbi:MAG: glycerol-3-phosphate acyltransferase [Chloroflexi bacterium]|nr:glycerol-3-phosphate acyltransferase [Chloroflexota bacterium]
MFSFSVLAWFVGGIPFVAWFAHLRGIDLRQVGTGNVGSHNLATSVSLPLGVAGGISDFLKGVLAVRVAQALDDAGTCSAVVSGAVVAGQCWPKWHRSGGGRGVATATGVMLATDCSTALPCLLVIAGITLLRPLLGALDLTEQPWRMIRNGAVPSGVLLGIVLWPLIARWKGRPSSTVRAGLVVACVITARRVSAETWPKSVSDTLSKLILDRHAASRGLLNA